MVALRTCVLELGAEPGEWDGERGRTIFFPVHRDDKAAHLEPRGKIVTINPDMS
ncbi:hypothetical protein [Microbispora sp. NPDC049633]|uniref:hypothetical protein n=1 Tax=Microbispora sp. NPDC049633 TaxID=3154355 RepID=UPI0034138F21